MKRFIPFVLLLLVLGLLVTPSVMAQNQTLEELLRQVEARRQALLQQYQELLRQQNKSYLGTLSANPYAPDSVSNPYGRFGNPYGNTVTNPYSANGNRVNNPYGSDSSAPLIVGSDGKYLGRLSSNPYGLDSVSNPYGRYGSPYSPDSINNQFGKYGSPYSPYSVTNPFASSPPKILAPSVTPSYGLPLLPPLFPLPKKLPYSP